MKRCLWIVAAALLTAGCVNNRGDEYDPVVEVVFAPVMHGSVRSVVQNYPDDMPFGVCAWSLPSNRRWETERGSAEEFLVDERVAHGEEAWSMSRRVEWPSRTMLLSFLGYAPYDSASGCDRNAGVRFDGVDTRTEQTDLLYTDPLADVSKFTGGGVVHVVFRHALCKVDFRMHRTTAGEGSIVVRRIWLESVRHKGDFASLREPQWILADEAASELFFEGEAEAQYSIRPVGEAHFMIPQRLDCAVCVELDYVNPWGGTVRQRLSTRPLDSVFEAGRHYTCTLTLSPDEVQFLSEAMNLEIE